MTLTFDPNHKALPWRVDARDGLVYRFELEDQARAFIAKTWPLTSPV